MSLKSDRPKILELIKKIDNKKKDEAISILIQKKETIEGLKNSLPDISGVSQPVKDYLLGLTQIIEGVQEGIEKLSIYILNKLNK